MCIVYEFPMKKEFPKEMIGRLEETAKAYIDLMKDALEVMYGNDPTEEEYEEFMVIMLQVFMESASNAIDKME